jgi:hypothetical protein
LPVANFLERRLGEVSRQGLIATVQHARDRVPLWVCPKRPEDPGRSPRARKHGAEKPASTALTRTPPPAAGPPGAARDRTVSPPRVAHRPEGTPSCSQRARIRRTYTVCRRVTRGCRIRTSEPQSDDIGCCELQYVAESAYLSRIVCWRLRTVAARCALGGVSSGVKVIPRSTRPHESGHT